MLAVASHMSRSSRSFVITVTGVVLFIFSVAQLRNLSPATFSWPSSRDTAAKDVRYIFAFGDSYSESSYNPRFDHPNTTLPFGRTTLGHTTVGGPTYLHYLVNDLLPDTHPSIVFNFASSGAVFDDSIFEIPWNPDLPDFPHQAQNFENHLVTHRDFADWNVGNSVFVVWFGANDVNWARRETDGAEERRRLERAAKSAFRTVNWLYWMGARRFVMLDVPSLWRTAYLSGNFEFIDANGPVAQTVHAFNGNLHHAADEWLKELTTQSTTDEPEPEPEPETDSNTNSKSKSDSEADRNTQLNAITNPDSNANANPTAPIPTPTSSSPSSPPSQKRSLTTPSTSLTFTFLDTTSVWDRVLDAPKMHGAPNATCFANLTVTQMDWGNGCLWQDWFHPGRALNLAVAEELKRVLEGMGFWR